MVGGDRASGRRVPQRFLLLVYGMPTKPTAGRVAVWRNLKKTGAVYLQDSVCVIPDTLPLRRELAPVLERIDVGGGHALDPVSVEEVDRAPVRQGRHRQVRHRLERLLVVQ